MAEYTLGEHWLPNIRASTPQILNFEGIFAKTSDIISFELCNKNLLNI